MSADYETAVRAWAAQRLNVSPDEIVSVAIEADSGWGGTDITGEVGEIVAMMRDGRTLVLARWDFADLLRAILDAS